MEQVLFEVGCMEQFWSTPMKKFSCVPAWT
jgi:hypothetical protein